MSLEKQGPGAILILVILSTDKTQLTLFQNQSAYPVYLTIGNIQKDIHLKPSYHAQILVGYIPTTRLEHVKNLAAQHCALASMFHRCMCAVVAPLTSYSKTGVAMMSGNSVWHWCHPILVAYIGDYLEQVLVTCTYSSHCPKCTVPMDQPGDFTSFPLQDCEKASDI